MIWKIPSLCAAVVEEGVQLCRTWFCGCVSRALCEKRRARFRITFTHWLHHGTYLDIQSASANAIFIFPEAGSLCARASKPELDGRGGHIQENRCLKKL